MTPLVGYLLLFIAIGVIFVFFHLVLGKLVRPSRPETEKLTIYECGEPTIGSSWIQFDLRFYVVALLFVIFDVEVAFFFPWAVVFGQANSISKPATADAPQLVQAKKELLGKTADYEITADESKAAGSLAWIAFWDILAFFGILLVGFAYLRKRGDINWVRSMVAEEAPARIERESLPEPKPAAAAVAAGHH